MTMTTIIVNFCRSFCTQFVANGTEQSKEMRATKTATLVKSQAQTLKSTIVTEDNFPSLSSSLSVFSTNAVEKYDEILASEFGTESDARWLYWEFFMEKIDKPVLVTGIATNLCILSYAGTLFKYSYIVKRASDNTIVFSNFADNKCKMFTSNRSVTLLDFQSTLYEFTYVYNAVNLTVAFSNSLKPPLPTNVSYATNLTFNSLSGCSGSRNAQATNFVAFMENVCITVFYPQLGKKYKKNLKFAMPYVRQYADAMCTIYLVTEFLSDVKCLFPMEKGALSYDIRKLAKSGDEVQELDSLLGFAPKFLKWSSYITNSRQLVTGPVFDDDLWQPYDDDDVGGVIDPMYGSRNPMRIYMRWKQIYYAELTAPPTLSPLILPGISFSPSRTPTRLPTTAPTIILIYYHLRVTQQLLNIKASTMVADELSRAVFSKAVSVLVSLPYNSIQITNISDTYQPLVLNNSSVAHSMTLASRQHEQFATDNSSDQSDILSVISTAETTNRYSFLNSLWLFANKLFLTANVCLLSIPPANSVNMSCYVTYIIEFTPAQLNHTDPKKAYQQIKNQLTKRATSGIQTLSIVYFATNKNSTSLFNVDAATAPIISSFSITPSDIPNYPDGHSATDNVKAVTVLSVTIVGGITILLTIVWFVFYVTGSVRVFASDNSINNNNNVEPNELADVEIALVVGEDSPAALQNNQSNVAVVEHYSNNYQNQSQRSDENDWSLRSL